MKKTLLALSIFMVMALVGTKLNAALETRLLVTTDSTSSVVKTNEQNAIMARVYEIKKMDKSNMTSTEKKGLRKELRSLKKRYREGRGIYISAGAVIIIIILLILVLR